MNWFIRASSILAVLGIAVVAGWVSYTHAYHVALTHHETGTLAQLYPLTVDGLIYAASMVVLDHNRRLLAVPRLARWVLWCGIIVAVLTNVWYGFHFGWTSALIAAWPAPSLVLSYELLMRIIRVQAGAANTASESSYATPEHQLLAANGVPVRAVPSTSHRKRARHEPGAPTVDQAEAIFKQMTDAGLIPSKRQIRERLRVGAEKADAYYNHLSALALAAREEAA